MKILHTESSCGWGGQEIRILTESQGMILRGHEVTIACPKESNIYSAAKKAGMNVIPLPIGRKKLSSLWAMHSFLSKHKFDVINTHSSTDSWLVSLSYALKNERPRIVRTRHLSTTVHNNKPTQWLYTKGNDFIVTTGEQLRLTLHKDNGIPLAKMKSVPTGIDENKFTPPNDKEKIKLSLDLPSNKPVVGILATIRSWKGHEYLVEAMSLLRNKDFHLLIVGDGPHREKVEEKIRSLDMSDKVSLVGNQENVVPWLQAMDIFCLPSYGNEGVPQGIMQAMLCGLPIVSTNVGSILEVLHHDQNGYCVKTKDSHSLAEAISKLLSDEELREKFGNHSASFARDHCTMTAMIDEMEIIFS